MRSIGIDPGALGAIALLDKGKLVDVVDMPFVNKKRGERTVKHVDAVLLALALERLGPFSFAAVEQVGSRPGEGVSSSFAFGRATGVIEGVLAAARIPIIWGAPQVWKRESKIRGDKSVSRGKAIELWPAHAHLFARAKDDGRAEAALIGLWGYKRALADLSDL